MEVDVGWDVGISCFLSGFAMSTKAMLAGGGVAGAAQLDIMKMNIITT
jgi:hypothetical protein